MNRLLLFLLASLLFLACKSAKDLPVKNPPGYNLEEPEKFIMPDALLEVSGIAFRNGNSDTLYAQQDEDGKLFKLKLGEKKNRDIKFNKRGDYEDLTILKDNVFLLQSYGGIFSFPLSAIANEEDKVEGVREWDRLMPDGEFEGMFGDPASGKLFVICKQCTQDKGTDAVSGVIFQVQGDSAITKSGEFTIDTKNVKELVTKKGKRIRFQPSALAIHPITKEWFIVSSVNKMLMITDANWKVKDVYPLDPSRFRQPEGMAFDTAGNLYISNEGDEVSNGNVLKFAYRNK